MDPIIPTNNITLIIYIYECHTIYKTSPIADTCVILVAAVSQSGMINK